MARTAIEKARVVVAVILWIAFMGLSALVCLKQRSYEAGYYATAILLVSILANVAVLIWLVRREWPTPPTST